VKLLRVLPILSTNIEEILSRAHGNFEEPNKFLQSSTITINYRVFIIKAYSNYTINSYNYCISNKVLVEECSKAANVEVTGAVATSSLKIGW